MDWSFCVMMKRNSMILWTQDCRHLYRKIHSFSGVLWFPCHGCRSELLSTWNRWGRGRSDWKQNRQKWRQLRYWSNGSDKSIGNYTWYFLRAPPATWRGRLCIWIASRFHYQENRSIETFGAWSWNHAWHSFASRIAEERILYISRFDPTHTSIWQSLECFHSSVQHVQLWCIPLAYLEMQRQVESSSLGIAVGLFSWTYRLVPRCNSHALFARLWHCWGPMGSQSHHVWYGVHGWCEPMVRHCRRNFFDAGFVSVSISPTQNIHVLSGCGMHSSGTHGTVRTRHL